MNSLETELKRPGDKRIMFIAWHLVAVSSVSRLNAGHPDARLRNFPASRSCLLSKSRRFFTIVRACRTNGDNLKRVQQPAAM